MELEAFRVEHDLGEEEIEQLTREWRDRPRFAPARAESEKALHSSRPSPIDAVVGSADSLQLFLADVGATSS